MAETKLLPLELRQLVCCRLLSHNREVITLDDLEPTGRVVPLELGKLRRTTRRVAALLRQPEAGDFLTPKPKARFPANICYVCRALNPFTRTLRGVCHHLPPAPHPSFISEKDVRRDFHAKIASNIRHNSRADLESQGESRSRDEEDEGVASGDEVFDTSVLHAADADSPAHFSLPPVFSKAGPTRATPRTKRVVPMVSENTFVTSNCKPSFDDEDDGSDNDATNRTGSGDVNSRDARGTPEPSSRKFLTSRSRSSGEKVTRLPEVRRGCSLVGQVLEEDDVDEDDDGLEDEKEENFDDGDDGDDNEGKADVSHRHQVRRETLKTRRRPGQSSTSRGADERAMRDQPHDLEMTSRSDPGTNHHVTLESELTGASLHIDEDYVPMSVTIKKLTEADLHDRGFSRYQDYSDVLSDSLSGSLGVSRDTSLADSEEGGDSPSSFMARLREASWCECPQSDSDSGQCRECRGSGGHENWCVSAGSVCHGCRKPIKKVKGHAHMRRRRSTKSLEDPASRRSPDTMIATLKGNKSLHDQRGCSAKQKERKRKNKGRGGKKSREADDDDEMEQRVRFNDTVQQVSPDNRKRLPKTALDYENLRNYDHVRSPETSYYNKQSRGKKGEGDGWATMVERDLDEEEANRSKKVRERPKSLDDYRIPGVGVNVHRAAYILALQDARIRNSSKKNNNSKKKKRGGKKGGEATTDYPGTVFSYFPLLRKPVSESESTAQSSSSSTLGLRQAEGSKVKLKNAMKHIFGSVKMADYYPGGSRWRKLA
ncbi:uncharacterized protein LOC101857720 [Aplysia californica]|uniref:Uncharacterized protein LOC101857720 n=1 Tax=Aplysia californica TaxID=6500 RepID=A0ABM1A0M8_APLCA|nr:uncharacterized protein LOC101857720 [Aplysia californica]